MPLFSKAKGNARQRLGQDAEAQAEKFLRKKGLKLIERNWKAPPHPGKGGHGGELDLIMTDGDILVFVEVRATSSRFGGGAAMSVGPKKMRQVMNMAKLYLRLKALRPKAIRFDVVAIDRGENPKLQWYPNAFTE